MRVFVGLLGGLFVVLAVVAGGFAGLILVGSSSSGRVVCNTTASQNSTTSYCDGDGAGDSTEHAAAIAIAVGAAGLFVGGCALLGGVAAGSGRRAPAAAYQPQPVPSGGPPSYGS